MTKLPIWSDEASLRASVVGSKSIGACIRKLPVTYGGRSFDNFRKACANFGIDIDFENPYARPEKIPDEKVFVENSPYTNNRILLKERILKNGWLDYLCAWCGLGPEWNGKPLTLQLDHINGKNNDHRIENLRFLCPNCHTQTNTYAGKRRTIQS